MRRAVIYPFSVKSLPVYTYFPAFCPEYEISALISPLGLGLAGHDPMHAANRSGQSPLRVESGIEEALKRSDALIVPCGDWKTDPVYCDILPVLYRAAEQGKEIFCCLKLAASQAKELKKICRTRGAAFHDGFLGSVDVRSQIPYGPYTANAPVVFVHDLGIEADSFEIVLSLAARFRRDGYRVSVIGPRPEYNLLGFCAPSPLLNMAYGNRRLKDVPQFVAQLQLCVNLLELREKPDVILLHSPGATMSESSFLRDANGVYTYLLSRAVQPDFSLACMTYGRPNAKELLAVHYESKYQYGFGIDAAHLSNRAVNPAASRLGRQDEYFFLPEDRALEAARQMREEAFTGIPVFSALNEEEKELLYAQVQKYLGRGGFYG